MKEADWKSTTRLFEMLPLVQLRLSDRKRRLFAVACCRRQFHLFSDDRSRRAVEVAERFADGLATDEERLFAYDAAFDAHLDVRKSRFSGEPVVVWNRPAELITHAAEMAVSVGIFYAEDAADYVRLALSAGGVGWQREEEEELAQCRLLREIVGPIAPLAIEPAWQAANDHAAVQLARWIADHQAFEELPFLADALEDAGCNEAVVLDHCRQDEDHVRGCWVLDILLGKA